MSQQLPMSFNFQGPFNLKSSAAGELLIGDGEGNFDLTNLQAGSNVTIDDTSVPGQITISASGESITLPTVANGVVTATNTGGNLATSTDLTFSSGGGFNLYAGKITAGSDGDLQIAAGAAAFDASGNLTANSIDTLAIPLTAVNGGTGSTLFTFGQATFLTTVAVSISDASITADSIIVVTTFGSTPLAEEFSVYVNAGVGFTIYSTNSSSTATVNYIRVG